MFAKPASLASIARLAVRPLRFRPFLWMALCALCGVALGGAWAVHLGVPDGITRADPRLLWPLPLAVLAFCGALVMRHDGLWWRVGWALCLIFGFAAHGARRVAPPVGDISLLAHLPARVNGPLEAPVVQVRGIVADYPRRAEFNTQFPLECRGPYRGRVWVRAPFDFPVRVGDEISMELELRPLQASTNLGEREAFWYSIGLSCWAQGRLHLEPPRRRARWSVVRRGAALPVARAVDGVRSAILARYETVFRGPEAAPFAGRPFPAASAQLLTAMVFGEGGLARPLPRELRDDFRAAGLSHVLVASGTQVTFIAAALILGLQALGARRAWLVVGVLPGLLAYALLAGTAPSIWRATAGGVLVALALASGRNADGLSLWGAALLALVALDPALAWSLSLQLTFAATWGLMCLAPVISRLLQRVAGGYLVELAALSLGAQWATLPISLFHFGTFSIAGLGANFFAVPLAGALVFTGGLGLIIPAFGTLNYWETRSIEGIAGAFANLPGAGLGAGGSSVKIVWVIGCYALFGLAMATVYAEEPGAWGRAKIWLSGKWSSVKASDPRALLVLAVLAGAALTWWRLAPAPRTLRAVMLDVGQGSAVVIISPRGRAILIDAGSDDGRADIGQTVVVPALKELGVERLEAVFLTHADAAHCNALPAVLRETPVGMLVDGAQTGAIERPPTALDLLAPDPSAVDYLALRRLAKTLKVPVVVPRANQSFDFDGVAVRVLAPARPLLQSSNDNSLVLRVSWGDSSILLVGDLENAGEQRLLRRGGDLRSSVLTVGGHGANTSSSQDFLRAVAPRAALVPVGRYNRDKTPARGALERLDKAGAAVFRTDLDGALSVECSRENCSVSAARQAGE